MGGIGSIGPVIRNFFRGYGNAVLCTEECSVFENSIGKNLFSNAIRKKGILGIEYMPLKEYLKGDWKNLGKHLKTAYKEMDNATIQRIGPNGTFMGKVWKDFIDIPACFKNSIKSGWTKAGTKFGSKLLGGLKGFGKAFMKKMPLIGGIMMLVGHIPNITAAFKDGGFGAGLLEIGKSGAKIGLDMAGFVIGQALIPIPFVGGLIGSFVLGGIGNAILGKGYKEKMAAKQQKATQNMIDSNPYQQNSQYQQQMQTNFAYNWQPPQMTNVMDQQQLAYAMNNLYGYNNSLQQYAHGFDALG